jgi:hypothetical protein
VRGAQQQLHDIAERLHSLLPGEDVEALEAAADLGPQADDIFKRASRVHEDFVAGQRRYAELAETLNDASVRSEAAMTLQVSAELGKANRAYWRDLTPEALAEAADALSRSWRALRGDLGTINDSELPAALARMETTHAAYVRAGELHAQAIRALTQVDADRLQASTALSDDVIVQLLNEGDAIGQVSPSYAEAPRRIRERVEELRAELDQAAPDFHTINANAQRLRREAETFVADYHQRLQHVHSHLGEIGASIRTSVIDIDVLTGDPRVDFDAALMPVAERARAWLTRYDGLAIPLDAAQVALAEGEVIARETDAVVSECQTVRDATS